MYRALILALYIFNALPALGHEALASAQSDSGSMAQSSALAVDVKLVVASEVKFRRLF